jgi:hypothetical protein
MLKVTLPVGIPEPTVAATDAEYDTGEPDTALLGLTEALVDVGTRPNGALVPTIIPPPTATQSVVEGHETPVRLAAAGVSSIVHTAPPFVVAMATPEFELVPPTARQSTGEGHEIPATALTAVGRF